MNNVSSAQPATFNSLSEDPAIIYFDKSVPGACLVETRCGHIFEQKNIFKSFDGKTLEDRVCAVCNNKNPLPLKVILGRCDDADRYCRNPALEAACTGNTTDLEAILTDDPEAVRKKFNDPEYGHEVTLLHAAVDSIQLSVVKLLLRFKADVNAYIQYKPELRGFTPLMLAIENGNEHTEIVDLLVQRGADVNAIMSDSGEMLTEPPILTAIQMGDIETVKFLVSNGAKVDGDLSGDKFNGFTPLMMAAQEGHVDIVKYLLKKGSNANEAQYDAGENDGRTPLLMAAIYGHTNVGKILVEHGADVDAVISGAGDIQGGTSLITAACCGNEEFVKFLLDKKANLNAAMGAEAKKGCTALWYASHYGYKSIVQALLEAGADPNPVEKPDDASRQCRTAYMAAMDNEHEEVAKLLLDHGATTLPPNTPSQ
ncbi:ankyrin repeat domain-containing protein [Thalassotalea sp. G20_0]|uniref:ankyrin repeat domain-containing protein n=1 Tax=Thalassotalea sp. G20_0 TaxID=2821093 RepID=UPI001ADB353A|nr:ankyrin repeat domain-containing protein [Thalassotalea sp. G20_0]MBO9495142.1 ankyrin repeat domain-containing protein [Thalassotalea sp. G20_0]